MTIVRIGGGKLAEEWTEYDQIELMRQIGTLPGP
jgi:hypothetical protein